MDKKLEPPYMIPEDKLINLNKASKALIKAPKVKKLLKKRAKKKRHWLLKIYFVSLYTPILFKILNY